MLQSTDTMHAVERIITQTVSDKAAVLVAFDVDMTLTVPSHPALYYPNMYKHKIVLDSLLQPLQAAEKDRVTSFCIQRYGYALIEKETPAVVRAIQAQSIKTMAFTALLTGRLGDLEDAEVLRCRKLRALGFNFSQAFSHSPFVLEDVAIYNGYYPLYHQGVLYANGEGGTHNKGTVLVNFLQKVDYLPQMFIMVDDKTENLLAIQHALAAWHTSIQFVGIHYTGAQAYAPEAIPEATFRAFWQEAMAYLRAYGPYDPYQRNRP
ncbi:MAG: DUF2608 domain-containing protein [Bacteroidota bacterium]